MHPIPHLESLALSAWPALNTELLDGWVLRFAQGYTKRANSVSPLYPGVLADEAKVDYVERRYAAHGQPAIFKLTDASTALDALLAGRGYTVVDPTSVRTASLDTPAIVADPLVTLTSTPDDAWVRGFIALNRLSTAHAQTAQRMLAGYACPTAFAAIRDADRLIACGYAVMLWDSVSLFDIVTAPEARRQGHGRRLVGTLLAWGREQGASQGLLQVVADNAPAVALYAALGFAEQYRYWYRRQPG
ncbi:GNAT family N-acetyltransferase [Chitiniphilus eburneus]|uniref:GNAT family N-acetyltransferase n=1 Tax=Chitiniphilus eburneus TaxID=2571148 RepID=A0A4U0QC58_9NEIS|nr:GNAT family N-acetyltransferase [Chitiniphilus eburneus]TJZ78979.1 GNAT family N-acetyltransferase [Chitiniphilus eburneus]